jgi:hypothetical protein
MTGPVVRPAARSTGGERGSGRSQPPLREMRSAWNQHSHVLDRRRIQRLWRLEREVCQRRSKSRPLAPIEELPRSSQVTPNRPGRRRATVRKESGPAADSLKQRVSSPPARDDLLRVGHHRQRNQNSKPEGSGDHAVQRSASWCANSWRPCPRLGRAWRPAGKPRRPRFSRRASAGALVDHPPTLEPRAPDWRPATCPGSSPLATAGEVRLKRPACTQS